MGSLGNLQPGLPKPSRGAAIYIETPWGLI